MAEIIGGITQQVEYNKKTYEIIILYEDDRDYCVYARKVGEGNLEHICSFENEKGIFEALANALIVISNYIDTD